MTLEFNSAYFEAFKQLGLPAEQAKIYEILLMKGPRRAGQLPKVAGISRTYAYKQLEELIERGLVTKQELKGKPARFAAAHPFVLQNLVQEKQKNAEAAKVTIDGIMGALVSDYTSSSRIPGVRILRDIEGIAELQEDIRNDRNNVRLVRSTLDSSDKDLLERNLAHIKKCAALGIHTRLLGPQPDHASGTELFARDKAHLTERRILRNDIELPALMLIYGNKVALTSYQEPLITTLIENEAIALTMGALFELIWNTAGEPE